MNQEDLPLLLQDDVKQRIEADSYFADINVFAEVSEQSEELLKNPVAVLQDKAGKQGVCVIVEEPEGTDEHPNVQAGPLTFVLSCLVLEHTPTNRDTANGGTGKAALAVARRLHRVLKHYTPEGLANNLIPLRPSILPLEVAKGIVRYMVRFTAQEADDAPNLKVASPQITYAGGMATITCATPTATIWYTTDETHPRSGNPNALQYAAPFAVDALDFIRAVGYRTGWVASNATRYIVD